ncbi:MAG: hypothetical protein H6806_00670 [Planctomycetes bacterium]|nr:hypothetical protein [Planctomycetota bacterium]MCB9901430.1 hypothetical protein [Planctomycetota bacterium]
MRILPFLLTLVAAAAVLGVLLLRSPTPGAPDLDEPVIEDAPAGEGGRLVGRAPVDGGPDGPAAAPGARGPVGIDLRTVKRGDLDVVLVDAKGERVPTDGVQLMIERIGLPLPGRRLPYRDVEARTWTFRDEPVGRVRVKATGWHFFDAHGDAEVLAENTPPLTITVQPAGAIQVRVTRSDGTAPTRTHCTLVDEADKPVEAWWQQRGAYRVTPRVRGTEADVGPEGWITALPAGRYRLDIETEAGFRDKAWVDVTLGETATVAFTVTQ